VRGNLQLMLISRNEAHFDSCGLYRMLVLASKSRARRGVTYSSDGGVAERSCKDCWYGPK
jgi:hypothetical protein